METKNKFESGQILILLVLGIVVLLGFTALALDGGMIYSDRRLSQNVADASSLAGGGEAALTMESIGLVAWQWENCNQAEQAITDAEEAAIAQALDNDFVIDNNTLDHNGARAECTFEDYGSFVDKYIDVTTLISFTTDTSFAHFIYNGPVRNQVEAVTRVRPRNYMANGNAIVAHRVDCPNSNTGGVHFDGNAEVDVNGGGVFSNACLKAAGSVDVGVEYGEINYTTDYSESGNPTIDPPPGKSGSALLEQFFVVDPNPPQCADTDYVDHTGPDTIYPGNYSQIKINNGVLNMEPGLYCLSGNFSINGGVVNGNGVTIYITNGDFDSSANAEVHLTAPPDNPDPLPAIPGNAGLLIYLPLGNDGEVSLLGNVDSEYVGTVYAADPDSMIEVGGTGGVETLETYQTQLIGGTVFVHGNATIDITFNGGDVHEPPAFIELHK
ncbi:MAG: Tad domain-containing protein [Anaerolineales bacterium]|jgi:hypothetical protein